MPKNLVILYEHGPSYIPIDVYRNYLQERWRHYGVDYLSFSFSTRFWIVIVGENAETKPYNLFNENTKLINFIEEELDTFMDKDDIPTGSYIVEGGFTDGYRLFCPIFQRNQSHDILERLLEIAIVRGIEEAVFAFDRSCCSEGVHGSFQYVALVDGMKIETEIQIFEGVRLIPLPSLKTKGVTVDIVRYLPGFPFNAFRRQADSFFGKTLLVIDQPGFSIFHKPPGKHFEFGTQVADLPFQVKKHEVKLPNRKVITAFIKSFFQGLSLACNSPIQIYHLGWFLAEDKSLHAHNGVISSRTPFWDRRPFVSSVKVGQSEIEKAKCMYEILTKLDSKSQGKLQIAINRWIKSKTSQSNQDRIIDLAIALEALYLPDMGESTFKLGVRAAWYLGENKEDRKKLLAEFKELYKCRSAVVHGGELKKNVTIEGETISISDFTAQSQNRCRESIEKIIQHCSEEGKFPKNDYWDNLI
ncbi:hypothetical protein JT359_20000, partial [Candidatus Poribacteria bacterium]|nr:hypothetical protein [Candidatus Poribacteria bacterium]